VYCDVEPKRLALNDANDQLTAAQTKLAALQAKLLQLQEALGKLTSEFEKATAEKLKCQQVDFDACVYVDHKSITYMYDICD